jgi:ABC-type oligopeptide transport system substrate-binding subunit
MKKHHHLLSLIILVTLLTLLASCKKEKEDNPTITYPESGQNGDNILSLTQTGYTGGFEVTHSLMAELVNGATLKIKITSLSAEINPRPVWYYSSGTELNWSIADVDMVNFTQIISSIEPGKACDLKMFFDVGSFLIEYFEMDATTPTRTKTIICN